MESYQSEENQLSTKYTKNHEQIQETLCCQPAIMMRRQAGAIPRFVSCLSCFSRMMPY